MVAAYAALKKQSAALKGHIYTAATAAGSTAGFGISNIITAIATYTKRQEDNGYEIANLFFHFYDPPEVVAPIPFKSSDPY